MVEYIYIYFSTSFKRVLKENHENVILDLQFKGLREGWKSRLHQA